MRARSDAGKTTWDSSMHQHGWLNDLTERIAERLLPVDLPPPLGCHVHREDDVTEVTLFFGGTETLGGLADGTYRPARFHFDMAGVTEVFDEVTSFFWQPLTIDSEDDLGPHVSIEGTFEGNEVWLRVLARAPETVSAGVVANAFTGEFVQRW